MDHPSAMNSNGKRFGSLTKKSTKNILTDSTKHNSPISTAGERFCQSISTSSTAKRPKKALVGPIYSKSTNLGGQASVKKNTTESKKRYGSSARKEDSKTSKVRAGSNFASQISQRISPKPSYTLCNLKSYIPLAQQKQAATSIMTRKSGKRDLKVKALEAAEVAKQLEERRERDRKMRKELARRGELENKLLEKSKELNKEERELTEFECRKYTPSNAQWAHLSSNSSNHSENSVKCWGRQYPSENDYSHSVTLAGGILLDRKVSNSMDTDSKLFEKQAQEHAVCFSSEEKSLVEDENMDHPSAMNSNGKGFGSLTKKSTKNILTDSSKHNSPISTAGERFCQSISTSSMAKEPKKALMGPIYSKSTNLGGQASVKKNRTESKKRYGSSARKEDSKTYKVRAGSNFASQISSRISQKPSYTLCNLKSFIPLVQQKQAATSIMTHKSGKRDVKVKALEAAEVAKQLEERREQDRKMRKELARHGELEKKLLEKSKELNKGEREGKESSIACSDINKSISSGMARKQLVLSQAGTSMIGVDLKLRRAFEAKTRLEQEKLRKLEEKKRREEIRKKIAAEVAANKRKREQINKTDHEEKQRHFEVVQKQKKELEKHLRAEKEAKEQRRRALDDSERMRKAMEEETKKQRRIEKERDAAERRRQIEENAKSNKFASKDAKHMQEFCQHNKTTLQAQNGCARKVLTLSTSRAKDKHGTEGRSVLGTNVVSPVPSESNINAQSYEITPYKSSDVEDNDDGNPDKPIPAWARPEFLIPHIISQQHIDPDEIFTSARTCRLSEVFEADGSNRRGDFKRRSYSGEWRDDCFTWKEEYEYKMQMGYIKG